MYTLSHSQGYLRGSSLLFSTLTVQVRPSPYTIKALGTNNSPADHFRQLASQKIIFRLGRTLGVIDKIM